MSIIELTQKDIVELMKNKIGVDTWSDDVVPIQKGERNIQVKFDQHSETVVARFEDYTMAVRFEFETTTGTHIGYFVNYGNGNYGWAGNDNDVEESFLELFKQILLKGESDV